MDEGRATRRRRSGARKVLARAEVGVTASFVVYGAGSALWQLSALVIGVLR